MNQLNHIYHYLGTEGIRITVADITSAAIEAQEIHNLPSLSAMILGKILNAAAILATDFKNHEGVSLKWETNTGLGTIHADAYEGRYIRGFVEHPDDGCTAYSKEAEAASVNNNGKLFVTRYSLLKLPYVSAVDLSKDNVASCVSAYLNDSDQTLSYVQIEGKINESGKITRMAGFMAQLMPEGNVRLFHELFDGNQIDIFGSEDDENSLLHILNKEDYVLLGDAPVTFRCTCDEERIKTSLQSLPESEQQSLLEDAHIEIQCHYCGRNFNISRETLMQWFNENKSKGDHVQ